MSSSSYQVLKGDDDHQKLPKSSSKLSGHTTTTASGVTIHMLSEEEVAALPRKERLTHAEVLASACTFKNLKPINPARFRWTWAWLIFIVAFFTMPIWVYYAAGHVNVFYTISSVFIWFCLVWFFAIFFTAYYCHYLYKGMDKDYKSTYPASTKLSHLIILTIYKDPMEVIFRTVDTIAAQTEAKRIVMVIAWESRTPDREERTRQMQERYGNSFQALLFPVHPYGLPHEIASKAANANWGLRHAVRWCFETDPDAQVEEFMVSTCDADTLFHERYFESLSADYLALRRKNDPFAFKSIWQAPLFYNWNLDQNSFITRITGLLRTTMTMGCLIPYDVNPMSCFSFSLDLAVRGGYWHPQIFMDDVGFLETMIIGAQDKVKIRCLPVPVVSGPTSGATWTEDVWEWYVQVRRWGIGTSDNFHYFCVKISQIPFFVAIKFTIGYFLYYGVILCCGSLFGAMTIIVPFLATDDWYTEHDALHWLRDMNVPFTHTPFKPSHVYILLGIIIPYFFYACMFILDCIWIRAILHIKEDISLFRNILHWLLVAPSLLMLSCVQFWSYIVIAFKGKAACIHQLAGKATLGTLNATHLLLNDLEKQRQAHHHQHTVQDVEISINS